jgi:hypothetical protein
VEAVFDNAKAVLNKWMISREAEVEMIVLCGAERLVEGAGLDKGISANHGCSGASNWVSFKEHEEVVLPWPADMGRPNLMAIFINEPLCTEAKYGLRVLSKSSELSFDSSSQEAIVGVKEDDVFSQTGLEAQIAGRRSPTVLCA